MTGLEPKTFLIALALTGLLFACSEDQLPPTTTTPSTTTSTTTSEVAEGTVYDVLALMTHPNGVQIVVDRIELLDDSTVVTAHLINGSQFEIRVGNGESTLRTADGKTVALIERLSTTRVEPAGELDLALRFGPIPETGSVSLLFNQGGGSSPSNPSSNTPSFELGPIVLDATATRPALPDPVPVSRTVSDSLGVELVVEGINFTDSRIGVLVRISNPTEYEVRIAPTAALSVLEDDLGNHYSLVLPESEGFIAVPPGDAVAGTLVFAGRVDPRATTIGIALNVGGRSSRTVGDTLVPELLIPPVVLDGQSTEAPLPEPIDPGETIEHRTGVQVETGSVMFTESGMEVAVTVTNSRSDSVALAGSETHLVTDIGTRHPLVPLAGNPGFVVDANTTVEATLGFSGRIGDEATSVSLVFNAAGSQDDPATRQPGFRFGPYPLERSEGSREPVTARVFPVGDRSRLAPAELVVSQIDQISETLEEFDATEVDGGFRLTLPDSILFDFGSAELRPDSSPALTLIAEVLEFYADAEIIVVGHTDSVGSPASNQALSEQRARSVVDVLISEHRISADRLASEGRGADEPVAPNVNPDGSDNPDGRQLNRRVEIVVLTDEPIQLP
jgi:outer membrane protein OmpA-like peptidoglycan-associated protein